jgi:hypothetical protein
LIDFKANELQNTEPHNFEELNFFTHSFLNRQNTEFDVGRSMFDVGRSSVSLPIRPDACGQRRRSYAFPLVRSPDF